MSSNKLLPQKRILLDFYPSEAALIEHVEKQPKKQTYIKDLIRKDMVANGVPFDDLKSALQVLGISGDVSLLPFFKDRVRVIVAGKYFGIWDTVRKTFVD